MDTVAGRETRTSVSLVQRIVGGVIGGVVGGLVFGAMMAMMGMLPMVASVVGSKSAMVGFIYHMFNSVIIGIAFGLVFGALCRTYGLGALWGLVYGVIWWVLGPMILMPLLLGMGLQFSAATWRSVGGPGLPHEHSRETQIKYAKILQARSGWGQWGCAHARF